MVAFLWLGLQLWVCIYPMLWFITASLRCHWFLSASVSIYMTYGQISLSMVDHQKSNACICVTRAAIWCLLLYLMHCLMACSMKDQCCCLQATYKWGTVRFSVHGLTTALYSSCICVLIGTIVSLHLCLMCSFILHCVRCEYISTMLSAKPCNHIHIPICIRYI